MAVSLNSQVKTDLSKVKDAAAKGDKDALKNDVLYAAQDFALANPSATLGDFEKAVDKYLGKDSKTKDAFDGVIKSGSVLPTDEHAVLSQAGGIEI